MTRRVLSMVFTAVVLGVVAVGAWYLWPQRFGGSSSVVFVSGDSMEPTLSNHDLVLVRANGSYGQGDVIVYRIPADSAGAGQMVVHRVVGGDGEHGFVTQGDNRQVIDPWLPRDADVLGRVVAETQHGTLLHEVIVRSASPGGLGVLVGVATGVTVWRSSTRRQAVRSRHADSTG